MRLGTRSLFSLLIAVGMLFPAILSTAAAPAPRQDAELASDVTASTYRPDAEECAFLGLINAHRAQNGRGALTISRTLGAAAEHHSLEMAATSVFSHTLPDGTTWAQNIANFGYPSNTYRAENIAAGNPGAQATFNQWKNSSGHNKNMLNSNFNAIGIGRAQGGAYGWYWTTTFGSVVDSPYSCGTNPSSTGSSSAIALSKDSGKYNGLVQVSATGFSANSALTLSWDGTALTNGTSNQQGAGTLSFRVPLATFGNHTVTIRDAAGRSASATYRVIPRVLLTETSGPRNTTLRVYFYGFASGERVEVRWHDTDTSFRVLTTVTIASNGRGTSLITVPGNTTIGKHKIVGKVIGVSRSASETFSVTGPAPSSGTISLSKTSGKYNGVVDVTAIGFAPNSSLTLSWDGAALGTSTTDGSGGAKMTFRVPLATFGDHTVTVRDAAGRSANATYRVTPRVMLTQTSAAPGTTLRVYLYGYAAGERVDVQWYDPANRYRVLATLTVASNGRATTLITVPSGSAPGQYRVVGKVIGVNRSASESFTVTGIQVAEVTTPTPSPTASPEPNSTETPTRTPLDEVTPEPTGEPTIEPTPTPAETVEPVEESTPDTTEAGDANEAELVTD